MGLSLCSTPFRWDRNLVGQELCPVRGFVQYPLHGGCLGNNDIVILFLPSLSEDQFYFNGPASAIRRWLLTRLFHVVAL